MTTPTTTRIARAIAAAAAGSILLAACGSGSTGTTQPATSSSSTATTSPGGATNAGQTTTAASDVVLPVASNPISNTSTAPGLTIDQVLVENNVDASGGAAPDHLEIALSNSTTSDLGGIEIWYSFTDTVTGDTEGYYTKLPADFTIPAGGSRVVHFDNTGAPDHFPVNDYSLYATSTNALDVQVEVSATGVAPQTATVQKDAGGQETAD